MLVGGGSGVSELVECLVVSSRSGVKTVLVSGKMDMPGDGGMVEVVVVTHNRLLQDFLGACKFAIFKTGWGVFGSKRLWLFC